MLIAVAGGRLQGVEIVYLAKKAGFSTLVIDKDPDAPAAGLSDQFIQFKFLSTQYVPDPCPRPDLIIPAIENKTVLDLIAAWAAVRDIPMAFDRNAYAVSSSKHRSNRLFSRLNLPIPKSWNGKFGDGSLSGIPADPPASALPLVIKPDDSSGSRGVIIVKHPDMLRRLEAESMEGRVVQEYLDGPSFSIEVAGRPGNYRAFQVTDLEMDDTCDCCGVTAPTVLAPDGIQFLEDAAVAIAETLGLSGLMDLEVILHNRELKLLEIDARFPSQTPMAVFWSTGLNMIDFLASQALGMPEKFTEPRHETCVRVEHIRVSNGRLQVKGEHIMGRFGPLSVQQGFFGADEAITSFSEDMDPQTKDWVATLVFTGASHEQVRKKQRNCHRAIRDQVARKQAAQKQPADQISSDLEKRNVS